MSCYVHYLIHKYAIPDYDTTFNKDVCHKQKCQFVINLKQDYRVPSSKCEDL